MYCLSFVQVLMDKSFVTDILASGFNQKLDSFTIHHKQELMDLAVKVPEVLCAAREASTTAIYRNHFNKFKSWCQQMALGYLPAQDITVGLYMTSIIQSCTSAATINQKYYAISWAHDTAGLSNPCKTPFCQLIREGGRRLLAKPKQRKIAMTAEILDRMIEPNTPLGANLLQLRLAAICLLGFAGFLRFQEIVGLRHQDILIKESYIKLFIHKSKTDKYRDGAHVLIARTHSRICPWLWVTAYLRAIGKLEALGYVFRSVTYIKKSDTYKLRTENTPLSYTRSREIFIKRLQALGLDYKRFGLHSLRAGGASAAAKAGLSDRLFQRHGRWKSEGAKDGYIQEDLSTLLSVSNNLGL